MARNGGDNAFSSCSRSMLDDDANVIRTLVNGMSTGARDRKGSGLLDMVALLLIIGHSLIRH